jgi:HEAT repeat protein
MSFSRGPLIVTIVLLAAHACGPLSAAPVATMPSADSKSALLPVLLSLASPSPDDAARLLPELTRMTGDDDPLVRAAAAEAVGKLGAAVEPGPMTVTAVEALASLLHTKAPDVQVVAAAGALARIGAPSVYLASYILIAWMKTGRWG